MNVLERLNKTHKVFVCFDKNDNVRFGSVSESQIKRYARANNLDPYFNIGSYPIGCYMHDKENRLDELIYEKKQINHDYSTNQISR